jgi:probable F420-dependent oxidoreductase
MSGLRIDRGLSGRLDGAAETAALVEREGFDGCWVGEINHDPFLPLALAAEHTSRIELGTSIAVAFARNPMTVAGTAWDLQAYSGGRFLLGLGTQVRPHIERRFSMPWSHPARRMREFVHALRAIWSSWHDGTGLDFQGEFYTHTLMTPMFTPEPSDHVDPKVFVAAVGPAMTAVGGEVADGLLAHAFTTRRHLLEVTMPALRRGLSAGGRARSDVEVSCPVFVVTGADEQQCDNAAAAVRKQIAFYGSTPAYRGVLELHGWGDLHENLHRLSREGHWDAMGALITDEVLDAFAVVGRVNDIPTLLRQRCAGVIDRVLPSFPSQLPVEAVAQILQEVRR